MIIKNIYLTNNNFQKLHKKVIMPIIFASAIITGATSVDKFEKQETLQNKSITNTNSPVEGLLTASIFGLVGLYDDKKSRSLINAISNTNLENAKVLLQLPDVDPNFQLENGNTALGIAVGDKNINAIKELLKHPDIDPNIQDKEGDTPLYTAVRSERLEVVKELLKHPKINPNIKNNGDNSPLIKAIGNNNMEIINELLQHPSIDPNIQDKDGDTPLYTAVRRERIELVKELLKFPNIDPNIKNKDNNSPLMKAIDDNNTEIINELLQHPNTDPNVQDKDGDTPLYTAVRRERIELVKKLLKLPNINPNIQNNDDDSPLIRAIYDNNLEIFKALLQHPNIDIDIQDKYGDTALVIATERDKQEFVKELLKYEALNKKKKLEIQSVQQKHDETFAEIQNILTSSKVKTSQGACLNSTNFIPNVIDYLLVNATPEEKQEVIKLLKLLKNLSYNKTDGNRISAIEKILNAEDGDLLELLKGKDLEYKRDFDYVFDRIENDEFKQKVLNLKFTFKDLEEAVNIQSLRAIDKCKYQFESPLFSATKNGKELWNSVCNHWDNKSFVLGFIEQYYKYCSYEKSLK